MMEMKLTAGYKISLIIIGFLLAILSLCSASELEITGRLLTNSSQSEPSPIANVGQGRSVKLICDLGTLKNATKPQWSFMRSGRIVYDDVGSHCRKNIEKSKNEDEAKELKANSSFPILDCEVELDDDSSRFTLELKRLQKEEFGEYICLDKTQNLNTTFTIQEHVTLTRKNEKGKLERSVTVNVNDTLWLYCNSTGLEDYHVVSWWKDDTQITRDLNEDSSWIFKNFDKTDSDNLTYYGPAALGHRGNYTCEVNLNSTALKQFPYLASSRFLYPVRHSFYVRVQEGDRWILPLSVLSGEIALVGLFTLFLNWREKRQGEDGGDDSDDEDDVPPIKNGVNGNKNGK